MGVGWEGFGGSWVNGFSLGIAVCTAVPCVCNEPEAFLVTNLSNVHTLTTSKCLPYLQCYDIF